MKALMIPTLPNTSAHSTPTTRLTPVEEEVLSFLLPLSPDYPNIDHWFRTKVVPGLKDHTRTIIRIERHSQLIGIAIGKREPEENKICTVRVAPSYFGRGLGIRLFDRVLGWLDDDRPHLTISESKLPAFERIFDFYGFGLTSVRREIYRPHVAELAYNEPLANIQNIISDSEPAPQL
jgi:GNAT superfamily N-acetyltransferase